MSLLLRALRVLFCCLLVGGGSTLTVALATAPEPLTVEAARAHLSAGASGHAALVEAGTDAIDALSTIFLGSDEVGRTRFVAGHILGTIGEDRGAREAVLETLLRGVEDPWFNIRRVAAGVLGELGGERAVAALEKLATSDPYVFVDAESGEEKALVRISARAALEKIARRDPTAPGPTEVLLDDATAFPPPEVDVRVRRARFPFPGEFTDQRLFNNYSQPLATYLHGGLDLMHPAGTPVRAVARGTVAAVATNYPDWTTHHFFIVTPEKGGDEGWCYTHVDPASYTFEVGDRVRAGEVLGKLVDFSVGENDGADHLHLHYVRFTKKEDGTVDVVSLFDPLLALEHEDRIAPRIHELVQFVTDRGRVIAPDSEGRVTVRGNVDIRAAFADRIGREKKSAAMGGIFVARITLEVRGEGELAEHPPWRKLVFDGRGALEHPRAAPAFVVPRDASGAWREGTPPFPIFFPVVVTHSDGDGVVEPIDADHRWRTASLTAGGERRFPDGEYTVTIRAWDLAGNRAERAVRVVVENGVHGR